LAEVVGAYPTEADAASASYLLGSTRLMLDDLEGALKTYQETYDRFPQYENRSRALLRTGVCLAGMGQPDRAREAFQRVVDRYPSTDANVRKATKYLQEISIVGRPAPGVVADRWLLGLASEGDALQLFQGEVVVLVFFATWCENCEAELPHLRKLIDRWTQRGAVFLGIANPEDPKNTSPVDVYVQKNQIPFHDVALDRRSRSWGPYRVSALPAAVVIDRECRIAWRGHPSFFPTPLIDRLLRGASR
jgi:thiol-disulfide isomerase/thioredoxin